MGAPATLELLPDSLPGRIDDYIGRMTFMESIHVVKTAEMPEIKNDRTCIFYNYNHSFDYCRPETLINPGLGVINFPSNFQGLEVEDQMQIRITHPANYELWKDLDRGAAGEGRSAQYKEAKQECVRQSLALVRKIVGNFHENVVYQNTFTPLTVEHYSGKAKGALYGSPLKIKDGRTDYENLFIAGTDQGYLGIVGSMLSGVSMVNRHVLTSQAGP